MSYNAHDDFNGHNEAIMSLGKGSVLRKSTKQKLNVRSSTEGELVGADDMLGYVIWGK